jgi:hypothetical protein
MAERQSGKTARKTDRHQSADAPFQRCRGRAHPQTRNRKMADTRARSCEFRPPHRGPHEAHASRERTGRSSGTGVGIAHELLDQAHHLATYEGTNPTQAGLRRAVSTAYYALFHLLTDEAARGWGSSAEARSGVGTRISARVNEKHITEIQRSDLARLAWHRTAHSAGAQAGRRRVCGTSGRAP